jgi:ATP-dependent DNA helicase RecQ
MYSLSILKKYFGYEQFRPGQEEIINKIVNGKDCLVLMPTGGGKSVCYQVPALMLDGLTVVISPLIALMKDQVDALRLNGVSAVFLNSTLDADAQDRIISELQQNKIKLLYIAPERLSNGITNFITFLKSLRVSLFAIDEAHCISHWGHDFRPDYLQLSALKNNFPEVPVIALTATADKMTRADILDKLKLNNPEIFISSFNRSNIRYMIEEKEDYFKRILDFLSLHKNDAGIIYCLSRNNTEELAGKLKEHGIEAEAYHAGLDNATRTRRQEQFKRDEIQVIVATIAFGMGIDKSNVRFVIHSSIPKNIESYYQETGRSGRDGLPAQAILFYSTADVLKLKKFISVENNPALTKIFTDKLNRMSEFCQSHVCRRKYLLNYFDESYSPPCNNCDVCLGINQLPVFDGTIVAQKALSAVARLKQKFGIGYVINFLKGSESERIYDEHRYLPTFGKGKEFSVDQWRNYFRQLIETGYLEQTGEYSVLNITEKGKAVLFREQKVMLHEPKTKKLARKDRRLNYSINKEDQQYDGELFEELRHLRLGIAKKENVPPYLIFNDSTLSELAAYLPLQKNDLKHISGFGRIKIERYGEAFLDLIKQYCSRKNISSRMSEKPNYRIIDKPHNKKTTATNTQLISFEMYSQGLSISDIAKSRKLNEGTITDHLLHFIKSGQLNVLKFVSKEKLERISTVIDEHGDQRLSFIKEILGDLYSYTEIKAVVNYKSKMNITA